MYLPATNLNQSRGTSFFLYERDLSAGNRVWNYLLDYGY